MPLALLLSPDDQAVSAITSVLEEMSVTCERPLDGASAAQKLNSNRFDLVLVDCENLAAAKLIFDVCRNRKGAGRPVPVAVVDGRAGLPTAFRLGAELILTKPVAKDQARITIRTAISRVKREDAGQAEGASPVAEKAVPAATTQETCSRDQSSIASWRCRITPPRKSTRMPRLRPLVLLLLHRSPIPFPAFSAPPPAMEMNTAVAEPDTAPPTSSVPAKGTASKLDSLYPSSSSGRKFPGDALSAESEESEAKATTDDVAEAKEAAETKITGMATAATQAPTTELRASPDQGEATESQSEQKSQKKQVQKPKKTGHLVALFVLLVMCGGFYGAWTYEPGFQELAKAQINHLLVLLGMAPQPQQHPAPVPIKPASQTAKPSPGVPVQTVTPDAAQPQHD